MVIVTTCHMIVTCVRMISITHRVLKKHCLRHGDGNEMPYDCDLCRNVSTNLRVLKKHRLIQGDHLLGSAQTHKSRKI